MTDSHFETIESAHEYMGLLAEQVTDVQHSVRQDIALAQPLGPPRRLDAWRLVDYKLTQLATHLAASRRLLNDLRALRRLLMGERTVATRVVFESKLSRSGDHLVKCGDGALRAVPPAPIAVTVPK